MQRLEREPLIGSNRQSLYGYGVFQSQRPLPSDFPDLDSSTQSESGVRSSTEEGHTYPFPEDETILQACVFVEDAVQYRSINHKVDAYSLRLYRLYYSSPIQWFIHLDIILLHLLAFIEFPSSLVRTTDPRQNIASIELPCGVTQLIEAFCLLVLTADITLKIYLRGTQQLKRNKWLIPYVIVIVVSVVDWCLSLGYVCDEPVRIRRMLRPFFILQNSSLMKKTVNSLRKTLPQVISVLLLLCIHIYFFTLFGLLLFPRKYNDKESNVYFNGLGDTFINLLVLLTTANNPDVMMPAYSSNRFYVLYFILFLAIGMYCFMKMLTAVIFNQFRGYFKNSLQDSLFRRRLGIRAAFEVLRPNRGEIQFRSNFSIGNCVPVSHLRAVVEMAAIPNVYKRNVLIKLDENMGGILTCTDFQVLFATIELQHTRNTVPSIRDVRRPFLKKLQTMAASKYFTYFGCLVALGNVICISVELAIEYDHIHNSSHTILGVFNLGFIMYYLMEQILKMWALGWRRYSYEKGNIFDGLITILMVLLEISYVAIYGIPMWGSEREVTSTKLWNMVRIINMLITIRLLRIVTQINAMSAVIYTLVDLVRNLKAFVGIIVVFYYSYALLGMELFKGRIKYTWNTTANGTPTFPCGSYEQLEYWANNFNDFGASLVVLWDVMVVNNWHVFLKAYTKYVNSWSMLYFIGWWILTDLIALNLFTALILENFIMRWDRLQQVRSTDETANPEISFSVQAAGHHLTIHDMFRHDLQEPSEAALLSELRQHSHLPLNRWQPPITQSPIAQPPITQPSFPPLTAPQSRSLSTLPLGTTKAAASASSSSRLVSAQSPSSSAASQPTRPQALQLPVSSTQPSPTTQSLLSTTPPASHSPMQAPIVPPLPQALTPTSLPVTPQLPQTVPESPPTTPKLPQTVPESPPTTPILKPQTI